jgi:hypothetical protein
MSISWTAAANRRSAGIDPAAAKRGRFLGERLGSCQSSLRRGEPGGGVGGVGGGIVWLTELAHAVDWVVNFLG